MTFLDFVEANEQSYGILKAQIKGAFNYFNIMVQYDISCRVS